MAVYIFSSCVDDTANLIFLIAIYNLCNYPFSDNIFIFWKKRPTVAKQAIEYSILVPYLMMPESCRNLLLNAKLVPISLIPIEVGYLSVTPETIFSGGLEEAVAHLTSRPAKVSGIKDRGLVSAGLKADLVLFDPETVCDQVTFAKPQRPSVGIRCVLVNGGFALDNGQPTEKRVGRTIRLREDGDAWAVAYACLMTYPGLSYII